jgi:uncharacterized protein with PIN domain
MAASALAVILDQYGKGNHAKARVNVGDCSACALAHERSEPLLVTGVDASHTGLASVLDA